MEEAPNKRNALASLTEDAIFEILFHLSARPLFCCKCVRRSWKDLILDPNNLKKLPQTVANFFYDSEMAIKTSLALFVVYAPTPWNSCPPTLTI
jgi:hypothetical protein